MPVSYTHLDVYKRQVYLEQYWTSVPFAQIQQRYFDNFVVSTARIGCAR